LTAATEIPPWAFDWPPPQAEIAAAANKETHPAMGGIFTRAFDMDAEAVFQEERLLSAGALPD
jgi:hypothetical protein